jgi:choline dehydrogenase-like flavoprotein
VVIVGSGMGGATVAAALAPTGRRILILERGEHLRDEPEARDPDAIFARGHYRPDETWLTLEGERFNPGNYACVGGNTKFYGAVLMRYRAEDFAPRAHMGGESPGWPLSYDEIEPWYQKAEALYRVRGALGQDPTEPAHSADYPFPPVPDESEIADLRRRLSAAGLHPASLPLGVDIDAWLARARTPWDAFPDTTGAKMDAESVGLAEALRHENVSLRTGVTVERLELDDRGSVAALMTSAGRITAHQVVLAAGAVHTPVILLRSASEARPRGVANRSDQVGRNFMNHNCSALLALSTRRNRSVYQKTLYLNDWYSSGGPNGEPLGNVQLLGRVSGPILAAQTGLPGVLAKVISDHAIDFYVMSEDLPDPDSRITLKDGDIVLNWTRTNWAAHEALVAKLKAALRRAGYPVTLSKAFDRRTPSHQCGTARMGTDPASSVATPWGRAHDHANLWIADASVLPTSAAVNPSLTIAAHALRVAEAIERAAADAEVAA